MTLLPAQATRIFILLRARPTWIAQGASAFSSLVLVTLFTRALRPDDFATYAVIIATYAFGNALVGTTIGTRAIEALSTGRQLRVIFVLRRDALPVMACVLAAAGTAVVTNATMLVIFSAAAGMVGILIVQIGSAYMLGHHRYWGYTSIILAQVVVWDSAAIFTVLVIPKDNELAWSLFAVALGGILPALYLAFTRALGVVARQQDHGRRSAISAAGVASLALWVLASGDRLILAQYSLTALATYAAIYGLLDRIFRTLATAEYQQRLPKAFATYAETGKLTLGQSFRSILLLVGMGIVCSVVGPSLIVTISGGHYHPSLAMSTVLSFAMVAMLAAIPSYVALIASGKARAVAIVAIGAAGVNIVGNIILAPKYGTSSAAVLTLAGYLLWTGGIITMGRRNQTGASLSDTSSTEQIDSLAKSARLVVDRHETENRGDCSEV